MAIIIPLFKKNLIILIRNPLKSFIQLFFPTLSILFLSIFFHKFGSMSYDLYKIPPIDKKTYKYDFYMEGSEKIVVEDNNTFIALITNSTYHNKTFSDYLTDSYSGICLKECQVNYFKSEEDFVSSRKRNSTKEYVYGIAIEENEFEANETKTNFKLFSSIRVVNQEMNGHSLKKSMLNVIPFMTYNITDDKEISYTNYNTITFFQNYFAKYLLHLKTKSKMQLSISTYPIEMKPNIEESPITILHTVFFIFISSSFVGILLKFTLWIISEKESNINELLIRQGISKISYFASWVLSYFLITLIPFITIILCIKFVYFRYVNLLVIIICITIFSVNMFCFGFWLSGLFSLVENAQGVVSTLYIGTSILWIVTNNYDMNVYLKYLFHCFPSILLNSEFQFLYMMNNFEVEFKDWFKVLIYEKYNNISLAYIWIIGSISCLFYIALFVYFQKREKYIKQKRDKSIYKNILLSNASRNSICSSGENGTSFLNLTESFHGKFFNRNFEEIEDDELKEYIDKRNLLQLDNVNKKYGDFQAVKNFSCKLFPGQIFVLLGANGAGKTTLLKLISHFENIDIDPTGKKSDIVFNNHSLIQDLDYLYNNIGYCPQSDIYFNDLTVEEHLDLMIQLKKLNRSPFDEKEKILFHLGLKKMRNDLAQNLAEGNRRRLSLALGLIGSSKLILLDEPTSGMDFASKKRIWKYLKNIKRDKVIILTTHSLEEAEYLADVIGIMAEGELICCGSPSYLKKKYQCGYNINFILDGNYSNLKSKAELIAELKSVTNDDIHIKILGKDFLKLNFPDEKENGNSQKIMKLFNRIKAIQSKYFILDYTISTSSLEDVFLKVNDNEFTRNLFENELEQIIGEISVIKDTSMSRLSNVSFSSELSDFNDDDNSDIFSVKSGDSKKGDIVTKFVYKEKVPFMVKNNDYCLEEIVEKDEHRENNELIRHIKRHFICLFRNYTSFILQCVASSFFFLLVFVFTDKVIPSSVVNVDYKDIYSFYNTNQTITYQIEALNKEVDLSPKVFFKELPYKNNETILVYEEKVYPFFQLDDYNNEQISKFLYENSTFKNDKVHLLIINGASVATFKIFYALHSSFMRYPTLNLILKNFLHKFYQIETDLLTQYGPMPNIEETEYIQNNYIFDILVMFSLVLSFLLFNSYQIVIPLKERISEIKHINYLNGGNRLIYWIALFIFDYIKFFSFSIVLYIIVSIRDIRIWYTFGVIVFFGVSSILMSYIFSFGFREERHSWIIYFLFNLGLSLGMILIDFFDEAKASSKPVISYFIFEYSISDISPFSALRKYFMKMWKIRLYMETKNKNVLYEFYFKKIAFVFLMQAGAFASILALLELNILSGIWLKISKVLSKRKNKKISLEAFLVKSTNTSKLSKNESILYEREKVKYNQKNKLTLLVNNLKVKYRNIFRKSTVAVHDLYLGLEKNEKFGLMGYNGSGKTTTFKSIINEILYDSGSIRVFQRDIKKDFNEIRMKMGYCPQINSLFEYLTVRETFKYYFKRSSSISLDDLMKKFGLFQYKDVLSCHLSGGNKRKLVFAISLINNPQLILLDEPSTGVDPDSRRLMWRNISALNRLKKNLNQNFNLILSTHSFEEAEILCDKIGWMKKGTFTCMGNCEQLKLKYAKGYFLTIKFLKPTINTMIDLGITENAAQYENITFFDNLKEEHITEFASSLKETDKKMILYYYFKKLDEIIGMIREYLTWIHFVRRNDTYFVMLMRIQPEYKEYLFGNLLNLKFFDKEIAELSIMIEPLENFIGNI